jgi:hypothetical protein
MWAVDVQSSPTDASSNHTRPLMASQFGSRYPISRKAKGNSNAVGAGVVQRFGLLH